jgi:hypothetical protein
MTVEFNHRQSAHCESGVASNLLCHHGVDLSEPLIFGIGSGLFFGHMPFLKVNGIPATTYRILPGLVFKRTCKALGIKMYSTTYSNPSKAMLDLDRHLEEGRPVGMLTSVYFLPYLPAPLRFHFNAHNIVVYGKDGDDYLVSDPVMDKVTRISKADLQLARFAKGALPPKGRLYYPIFIPTTLDIKSAVVKGIKRTAVDMTTIPLPLFGVKGIRYLAERVRKYPVKLDKRRSSLFLGNIVRMQEEIGTGGAGFRFIFAAFLQEASIMLSDDRLKGLSIEMTHIGDHWREFAYQAARICKERSSGDGDFNALANLMRECADKEERFFSDLKKIKLQ